MILQVQHAERGEGRRGGGRLALGIEKQCTNKTTALNYVVGKRLTLLDQGRGKEEKKGQVHTDRQVERTR